MPPPSSPASFPLTVLLVSVAVLPWSLMNAAPSSPVVFPLTVLLVSVTVLTVVIEDAPAVDGGVVPAHRAVG